MAITKEGTHLIIKVEDNGEGIEPIQLQNLQEELENYTKKKNTKEDNRHTSIGLQIFIGAFDCIMAKNMDYILKASIWKERQ